MKKLFVFFLFLLVSTGASADKWLTFWTKSTAYGNIDIYYNDRYVGTITRAYSSSPSCGAPGCVTVIVQGSGNTWYAEAEDGSKWTSSRATIREDCTRLQLYGAPNYTRPSGSSSSSGYSSGGSGGGTDWLAGAGVGILGVALVVAYVGMSNDVYVNKTESELYNGFSLGLKQALDPHIDVEYGFSFWTMKPGFLTPSFLRTDPYPFMQSLSSDASAWSMDLASVYNFLEKDRYRSTVVSVNPYVGFGASGIFYTAASTYNSYSYDSEREAFAFGGIAGLSIDFGERFKIHIRYRLMHCFERDFLPVNQIELGLSLKYQKGFFFGL
ncbi:MAG: hypothetical protein LBF19_06360 [Prevotellaceae bacterium]|jgi:hypothetical protein|nr:hypothetical protein [Prevotellaceae bacterium]